VVVASSKHLRRKLVVSSLHRLRLNLSTTTGNGVVLHEVVTVLVNLAMLAEQVLLAE
jgi:hypothetical protein